jgi:hypothetical protein
MRSSQALAKLPGILPWCFYPTCCIKEATIPHCVLPLALKMAGYDGELILKKALLSNSETAAAVSMHLLDERI